MQTDDFQDDQTGDAGGDNVVDMEAGKKKTGAKKTAKKAAAKKAGPGHNSGSGMTKAAEEDFLRRVREIREAEAEAKQASDAVKALYRDAKDAGLHIAALRDTIKWNKKDRQARLDFETASDTYRKLLARLDDDDSDDA